LNAPCQFTPLLNLRPFIFGLTPFGWLRCITLKPTYFSISYENTIFDLRLFYLRPLFQEHSQGVKQGLGVNRPASMLQKRFPPPEYPIRVWGPSQVLFNR
jgi:hypothetical protein